MKNYPQQKRHRENKWRGTNEIRRVKMKLCRNGCAYKTHIQRLHQEQGGKQASLGPPGSYGDSEGETRGDIGVLSSKARVRSGREDSGSRSERVAIKLSEPRRKHGLPAVSRRVMILRYSPRGEVERKWIDGKHGRASRMMGDMGIDKQ